MIKIIDNVSSILRDDLSETVHRGDKVSIAAAYFSMYAYRELKKQLENVDEFRFIFTSPTFIQEKEAKQRREFYIPRLSREQSLYGTEFEVKLRNEMTQKAIARECADWIRRKAKFKSNVSGDNMGAFMTVSGSQEQVVYMPITGFTTVDLGCERGNNVYNMVNRMDDAPVAQTYMQLFNTVWNDRDKLQDVTESIIENITTAFNENSPEMIYFITLYNVFSEFLEDISEDVLPNEATGFKQSKIWSMLYDFQRDAVLAIINKLEKYNGCILADSVGLGKTFTALAVIKYYENRNKSVLVLCPKRLSENWNTYKDNYVNNPIAADRLNYDVLFHTDLSRKGGESNGLDLNRLNWGNYDLVVIDESHNFRNGSSGVGVHKGQGDNRYETLMKKVIRAGVKTKVLMLSATPVNNRFYDLRNQLALAYEGNTELIDREMNTSKSIDEIFRQAQRAFNAWSKLDPAQRTTDSLLRTLDFDFFELLDSVTIARSRKHIEKYYNAEEVGKFPERRKPISLQPSLTDLANAINYNEIYEELSLLTLEIYTPSAYIFPSKLEKYVELTGKNSDNMTIESCQKTVPEAITAFLEGTDFEDVIRTAVSLGGDCDTLTCIAGGMAEAMYGVPEDIEAEGRKRLPEDMLAVLDRFAELKQTKDAEFHDPFLDGNELIEEAISTYHNESTKENLCAVLDAIRSRMHQDGHFMIPAILSENGEEFSLRTLQTKDGKEWLAAFTTPAEHEKGAPSQIISNFIDAMLKTCLDSEYAGLIINPWDKSFMLTKALIDMLIKADGDVEYTVPDDPITPELLEGGAFLKRAVSICNRNRTQLNMIKLLRILRDSWIWIPCNAIMSDTDNAAMAELLKGVEKERTTIGCGSETFQRSDRSCSRRCQRHPLLAG